MTKTLKMEATTKGLHTRRDCPEVCCRNRLTVFKNKVLKIRLLEPKRDKVTRGWRKLQNEELTPKPLDTILG